MTNLLTSHPTLSIHLTDPLGHALSPTTPPLAPTITSTFLTAHDAAARLGFGAPRRITAETGDGAALVQSLVEGAKGAEGSEGAEGGEAAEAAEAARQPQPQSTGPKHKNSTAAASTPLLVATVVMAQRADMAEARVASAEAEAVARRVQGVWGRDRERARGASASAASAASAGGG
ncbi:MAG: hypothetical protein M1829_003124 [Trizodia sp. TS-e1964]|nr:MAG: hypothetical protein M1829_003124 [Trizodia sp. TS-e1964]